MKFLHLSDLHIGKSVNGFSMLDEQRHAFAQIIAYIGTERPAAVAIAGDVYDRAVPSVEAVRVFDDFLTELAGEDVSVLLISGNHDSPERLDYACRLLSKHKLHICGSFDGTLRHITLQDTYGDIKFWLLPFIKPSGVRGIYADKEIESHADAVNAVLDSAEIDYTERNVLLSHQFYISAGVTPIRSESEINPVGGLDAVDAGALSRFDYVALGHLHGRQTVGGSHIRYAGSPIKYSFSERKQDKSITLVEIKEKGDVTATPLPIAPLRDMREIKGPLEELLSDAVSSQGNKEDYLRVALTDEEDIIDPMGKLRSVYPNIMALDFENARTGPDDSGISLGAEQLEQLSPYDLFCEFFLEMSGATMAEGQARIVRELLEKGSEA
jgi:exonuclease SbcD